MVLPDVTDAAPRGRALFGVGVALGLVALGLAVLGACGDRSVGFGDDESDAGSDAAAAPDATADTGPDASGVCDDGQFRCVGDQLETCKADQSGFQPVATCAAGRCDAPGKQCDTCTPGEGSCDSSGGGYTVCDATGQSEQTVGCSAPKPFCVVTTGAPSCVECKTNTDCPPTNNECQASSCSASGSCGVSPVVGGTPCGPSGAGGKCDAVGACVYCQPGEKRCSGTVPETCDAKGQWSAGNACSGATPMCVGGDCVECQAPSSCPATTNDCLSVTCKSAQCGLSPKAQGTPCAASAGTCDGSGQCNVCQPGSKTCNGNVPMVCGSNGQYTPQPACSGAKPNCSPATGSCVECTSATQCPGTSSPCLQAVCASNACGIGNQGDGTACALSGDSGSCASGVCKVCTPGKTRCKSGSTTTLQSCDSSGQWQDGACPTSTPKCESGVCKAVESCHAVKVTSPTAHLSLPNTGWGIGTSDWTLEVWLKAHDEFAGDGILIALNESYLTNEMRFAYETATSRIHMTTYGGACPCGKGTGNLNLTSPPLSKGVWHHIAAVRTGGTGKLYVDGGVVDSDVITTQLVQQSPVAVGRPGGYPSYTTAPVFLGPWRFSKVARYAASFAPAKTWTVDGSTVAQFLVQAGLASGALTDEAGGDNSGSGAVGLVAWDTDTPCSL